MIRVGTVEKMLQAYFANSYCYKMFDKAYLSWELSKVFACTLLYLDFSQKITYYQFCLKHEK